MSSSAECRTLVPLCAPLGTHNGTSVQQPANDDAQASQANNGVAIDCVCGAATAQRSSCAISCAGCSKPTQEAYLLLLFKQTGGVPTKNNYDWVRSLITFLNLHYYCSVCSQSRDTTTSTKQSIPALNSVISQDILNMKLSIQAFDKKMSALLDSTSLCLNGDSTTDQASKLTNKNNADSSESKFFVDAVKSDLPKIVQTALSESIKAQKIHDRDAKSVIIFGLPKSALDFDNVCRVLQCHHSDDYVIRSTCIGHHAGDKIRPLKVELCSIADRNWVLNNAKFLSRLTRHSNLSFSK